MSWRFALPFAIVAALPFGPAMVVACVEFGRAADPSTDGGSDRDRTSTTATGDDDAAVGCCEGCTTTLAGQTNPVAVAETFGDNLLWANGSQAGGVYTCTAARCEPRLLALASAVTTLTYFAAATTVMYAAENGIFTVSALEPKTPTFVDTARRVVRQYAGAAYWLDATGIRTCASPTEAGCTPTSYVTASLVNSFDVNGGVYWTAADGHVRGCTGVASCAAVLDVASGQIGARAIVVDGTNVFWATGGPTGTIAAAAKGVPDQSPRIIAEAQNDPVDFANDVYDLYWVNKGDGTVMRGAKNPPTAATVLACNLKTPTAIVLSQEALYVANTGAGTIVRIPIRR
jgi:hypothetical protein